ncbi:MAG: molybdate ABC transporter substrate-binding protein [Desulforhopalus sp.]
MKFKVLIAVLLLQLSPAITVQAQTVRLSVAASMTDVFNEMMAAFSAEHTTVKFLPNFASSGSLAKQIEQGAPADIFVSANPKWMKYLVEKQLIETGTDSIFAYTQLVFAGVKRPLDLAMEGLPGLDRIALGAPQSVPAGQYAKQAMERVGIYAVMAQAGKMVMAKDVRQALIYADRGEVDGAFVYKTDVLLAQNAHILFTVPEDLGDRVAYPVALTPEGSKNDLAKAFYQYIKSPEAQVVLTRYGFEADH